MARTRIPNAVKQALRTEVGFGCPVRGCGNPYLEYHHFDPPVNVRPHNEPEGMIALCSHHHGMADGGAYTIEQLRAMKQDKVAAGKVKGNLEWLRNELLVYSGGNIYHETKKVLCVDGRDVLYFNRDENGYLALCLNMLTVSGEPRVVIEDNSWEQIGHPVDLRSPPLGRELEIIYENGDRIYLRFSVVSHELEAFAKYKVPGLRVPGRVNYPITVLELEMDVGQTDFNLLSKPGTFSGGSITGGFTSHCYCAISINRSGIEWSK